MFDWTQWIKTTDLYHGSNQSKINHAYKNIVLNYLQMDQLPLLKVKKRRGRVTYLFGNVEDS